MEATVADMNKMLSELTMKQVKFAPVKVAPDTKKHIYGAYQLLPDKMMVVKADIVLIGSLGGALLGLPKDVVLEGIAEKPMDETIRDAMHEIMNVSSTFLSVDKRAVFQTMHTDPKELPDEAKAVFTKPKKTSTYTVTVSGGYLGGMISIYTA